MLIEDHVRRMWILLAYLNSRATHKELIRNEHAPVALFVQLFNSAFQEQKADESNA